MGTAVFVLVGALLASGCDDHERTGPSPLDLTGTWTGTSTYPNAPFRLSLTQRGEVLSGEYSDALDRSLSVIGTFTNPTFTLVVDFGDAKLNLQGDLRGARTAEGVMFTSALGNREYPFVMTR